jgi:hypothetical protein
MKSVPVSLEGKTETHMEIFFYALGHVNSNCFVHVLLSPFAHFEGGVQFLKKTLCEKKFSSHQTCDTCMGLNIDEIKN